MNQPRVLVVDDEPVLAGVVASYLDRAGFATTVTGDGLAAVALAQELDPTVVILDLGLPGLDGVEVCRQIRTFSDCYVVMLTARDEEVDVLIGLSVGADDYVTKPFSARELVARVQVMLRRPRGGQAEPAVPIRHFGELSVDASAREAWLAGEPVDLTPTEFDLLAALSERPRQALSRRMLIERVWGDTFGEDHLVDVHVANLRRKLKDDATRQRFVVTVRGVGYRMGAG